MRSVVTAHPRLAAFTLGYVNTGWDLVFDLGGATVAATWLVRVPDRLEARSS